MRLRSLVLSCALFSACGGLEMNGVDGGSDGGRDAGAAVGGGAGGGSGGGGGSAMGGGGGAAAGGGGGTAMDGGSVCTDTWASYGSTFFATYCSACHHHTGQFSSPAAVQSELAFVAQEIEYRYMPQGYPLSAAEQARILAYLNCGAP